MSAGDQRLLPSVFFCGPSWGSVRHVMLLLGLGLHGARKCCRRPRLFWQQRRRPRRCSMLDHVVLAEGSKQLWPQRPAAAASCCYAAAPADALRRCERPRPRC
jgi:hypothetical protein